ASGFVAGLFSRGSGFIVAQAWFHLPADQSRWGRSRPISSGRVLSSPPASSNEFPLLRRPARMGSGFCAGQLGWVPASAPATPGEVPAARPPDRRGFPQSTGLGASAARTLRRLTPPPSADASFPPHARLGRHHLPELDD